MILNESVLVFGSIRKPRASGDDPKRLNELVLVRT